MHRLERDASCPGLIALLDRNSARLNVRFHSVREGRVMRPLVGALVSWMLAAPLPLAAQATTPRDTVAYATATLRVRAQPLANAGVVTTLAAGRQLRLYSCRDGWCRVAVDSRTGYALEEYLSAMPSVATANQGRGYVNSRGEWVPSPQQTQDNQPPAGATARCRDGTFSFSRSRSGTCSHHGGVAEWLAS